METYQAMNEQICEMLRTVGHLTEDYAALRIEELERQLLEAREAARAQSDAVQCHWLSPSEAEGLRQQLQAERQARREAELELEAVLDKVEV